jgi:ABC-type glycerol-3-phosphate transport system substrate-binding protein
VKRNKKMLLALLMAMGMVVLVACKTGDTSPPPEYSNGDEEEHEIDDPWANRRLAQGNIEDYDVISHRPDGARHIKIGIAYRHYYDSTHKSIDDNPRVNNRETAQMELDNVRAVEAKHNVYIEYVNMTWEGIRENIPISIMAGKPDADIYRVEAPTAVPAVLNNFAVGLERFMSVEDERFPSSAENDNGNIVMESVKIPGQEHTFLFKPAELHQGIYMIGYNKDLLELHNLEDPQKLWDEGRWTWDVFRDYCSEITNRDRNIYGWSGYWTNFLQGLLFSNNAAFAAGPVQTLDSPETMEVLNFISDLYNIDRSARIWDSSNWYVNNNLYARGLSGFWIATTWLNNEQGGGRGGEREIPLAFDFGMVPFPVGPSGNKDTMPAYNVENEYYFIPQYIKDPKQVYDVFYDFTNWFNYDLELRDDPSWLRNSLATEENFKYYMEMQGRVGFDLIYNLGILADTDLIIPQLYPAMDMMTPRQYVETYKTVYQAALDRYFK